MRPTSSDTEEGAVIVQAAGQAHAGSPRPRATILVVGERALQRGRLDTTLAGLGYDVVTAPTCAAGLELARTRAPDLVVCAVLMADMDGFEFVQALRDSPDAGDVRVVFWTAEFSEPDIRDLALACGVTDLICEPCAPGELGRTVRAALSTHGTRRLPLAGDEYRRHLRLLSGALVAKIETLEQYEREAAEMVTLLEVFGQHVPVGFGLIGVDGRHVHVNNALAAINGVPRDEHPGRTIADVVPGLWRQIEPLFRSVADTGVPVVNAEIDGRAAVDADVRHWLASFYPIRVADELIGIGVLVADITDRRREEALRSAVMDTMVEGVLVTDPDGAITYANAAASAIADCAPGDLIGAPIDTVVRGVASTRGGTPPAVAHPCEVPPLWADGATVHQRDGIVTRGDGTDVPIAFSSAPLRTGNVVTGCVTVFRDVTEERAERVRIKGELETLTWLGRIRDALAEDRFVLYAQPVVPLHGGTGGFELLLRMRTPAGDIIEPDAFLPIAERFGVIAEIDRWVIARAMRLAGPGADVGLNLSARSLDDPGLLDYIVGQFEATGVDPSCVVFEITETALMENLDAGQRLAEGLDALGSGVALDDFGTGFGSFTYLKRLPLRYLKIDKEFVTDLTAHPANRHLVKATVGLARDFGYQTIAEGVEDAETLAILKELGVDYAQGFHLGRPAPTAG